MAMAAALAALTRLSARLLRSSLIKLSQRGKRKGATFLKLTPRPISGFAIPTCLMNSGRQSSLPAANAFLVASVPPFRPSALELSLHFLVFQQGVGRPKASVVHCFFLALGLLFSCKESLFQ